MKSCRECGSTDNGFQKDRSKKDGFRNECKVCSRKKDEKRRREKPELAREKARKSYKKHRKSRLARVGKYYREKGREKGRERVRDRAEEVLSVLGGECSVCGRKDSLSIDHIMDDGKEERRSGSRDSMVRAILRNPDRMRYQILCHNHNQKKHLEKVRRFLSERERTGKKKTCPTCESEKDTSEFHKDASSADGTYYECATCTSKRREEIKGRAIAVLGRKCEGCGEDDLDVLSVDHRSPVGKEREGHGQSMYRAIVRGNIGPEKVQILCFNCNQGKGSKEDWEPPRRTEMKEWDAKKGVQRREYELSDLTVAREDNREAAAFLDENHYDGYGRHAKRCYSAKIGENIVMVVKMCSVTRQGTPRSLGLQTEQVLELDRMAAAPEWGKKNLTSWVLSRAVKEIKKDFPGVKALVSFADTEQGHDGTSYRASNWKESGRTARSYYYVSQSGERVKKKTFFDRIRSSGLKGDRTEREVAEMMGMEKVITAPKIRFVLTIS